MRIAVATDDGEHVAMHPGHCAGYLLYDVSEGAAKKVDHQESREAEHVHGQCHSHDSTDAHGDHGDHGRRHERLLESLAGVEAMVSRGYARRLSEDLKAVGINVYVCETEDADTAAQQFAEGKLIQPTGGPCARGRMACCGHGHGHHGHGHGNHGHEHGGGHGHGAMQQGYDSGAPTSSSGAPTTPSAQPNADGGPANE